MWQCPSAGLGQQPVYDPATGTANAGAWRFPASFAGIILSIGVNQIAVGGYDCTGAGTVASLGQITRPAETVVFSDSSIFSSCGCSRGIFPEMCCGYVGLAASADYARHNGGNNYTFCDGHAKWMAAGTVLGACAQPGVQGTTNTYFQP